MHAVGIDVPDLDLVLPFNGAGLEGEARDIAEQASAAWEAAVCWKDDYAIKRLAELTDDHQIIHAPTAKGPKHIRPILRKRMLSIAKRIDKVFPVIAGRQSRCWEVAKLHGFDHRSYSMWDRQY